MFDGTPRDGAELEPERNLLCWVLLVSSKFLGLRAADPLDSCPLKSASGPRRSHSKLIELGLCNRHSELTPQFLFCFLNLAVCGGFGGGSLEI